MRRLVWLIALVGAAVISGCGSGAGGRPGAGDAAAAQSKVRYRLYWLGRTFEGLPLTSVASDPQLTSFIYGTCDANAHREGGCAPPLELQQTTVCARNALLIGGTPRVIATGRGAPISDYGDRLELDAGDTHITVFATPVRARSAIDALRPVTGSQRVAARLPAPRQPRYDAREEPARRRARTFASRRLPTSSTTTRPICGA